MTRQQGYIKISRAIAEHWIWQNAEHLKWWLDLLFMAEWKDTEKLKRGQLRASIRYLQDRWARYDENDEDKVISKPSKDTVSAFLAKLERGTLIRTLKHPKWGTLITIINYERYQGFTTDAGDTNKDTKTPQGKDKYEEYIYNTDVVVEDVRACDAREGKFSEELKNDMTWCEAMQINHHINRTALLEYIDKYDLSNICNGKTDNTLKEAKCHFNNWLRIKIKDEHDEQRKLNNRPLTAEEARHKRMQEYAAVLTTVNLDGTVKHGG